MYDTLKPIIIAILLVLFGTGNGHALSKFHLHQYCLFTFYSHLQITVLQSLRNSVHYVPISIRRAVTAHTTLLFPLKITRLFLYLFMSPIGNEKKWIYPIKQDTWKGVWIDTPNMKDLKQVQDAAANKDLIILYIHGKEIYYIKHASLY